YPFYTLEGNNLHEVAEYITVPGIQDPPLIVNYMNLDKWNSLPEDIQEIIEEVVAELEVEAVEASKELTRNSLKFAEENDVTINYLSEEEYDRFVESSLEIWDEYESINEDTKRMVEILKEIQEDYLEENPESEE